MRVLFGIVVALLVLVAVAVAYAVSPRELETVARPDPASFDRETVTRGRHLAMIGNCIDCHTVEGGESYAGGRAIPTPLGTIYGTNITPDDETGIGTWSREAFSRAMQRGLDREGNHLYPAFPYHHFTKMLREDVDAIYAYLMTREPVANEAPGNDLAFPFNIRPLLAGWKLLYLDDSRFTGHAEAGEEMNRGAYLVQGPGHCGGCHTPRNLLQAEKEEAFLAGAVTENWHAPALAGEVPAATAWDEQQLTAYLSGEWVDGHGVAMGPMAPVAHNLSRVPEEDVAAISTYIASLMEPVAEQAAVAAEDDVARPAAENEAGQAIYAGLCAQCHEAEPDRLAHGLPMSQSTTLRLPDARNLIHIVEEGVKPPDNRPGPYMPGLAGTLTDEQMVALSDYLRARFTDLPPWENPEESVSAIRSDGETRTARTAEAE